MKLNTQTFQELAKRGAKARLAEIEQEAKELKLFLEPRQPQLKLFSHEEQVRAVANDSKWTPERRKAQGARMRRLWRAGKFDKR